MTDERQKKTTEEYRSNWDSIFKKKKSSDYQDVLSTEDCVIDALNKVEGNKNVNEQ
jgi:hypothetical protein